TAANLKKEQEFYESDLTFSVTMRDSQGERVERLILKPDDNAARRFRELMGGRPEVVSVEWTHRHYVHDDEYVAEGQDIAEFLNREIGKPIIRWNDSSQLGYEFMPNKYFYKYQTPTPTNQLLAEFWALEERAEGMLGGLERS